MSENEIRCMKRVFTLIEIMVALGALMLMMSFLFEFVIGAQRIWRASEHKSGSFDDAETVLSFVGEDIRNMRYSNQIGFTRPFFVVDNPTKIQYKIGQTLYTLPSTYLTAWMFYTQFKDSRDNKFVGVYPVVYIYLKNADDSKNEKDEVKKLSRTLFRVPLVAGGDGGITVSDLNTVSSCDFTTTVVNGSNKERCDDLLTVLDSIVLEEDNILMQDVMQFDLELIPPENVTKSWADTPSTTDFYKRHQTKTNTYYAVRYQPRAIQLKVSISPRDAISDDEWDEKGTSALDKNERSFTKTISLDTN